MHESGGFASEGAFESFCVSLEETLDSAHPDWDEHIDEDDVRDWVRRWWPLPERTAPDMRAWARALYRELVAADSYRDA